MREAAIAGDAEACSHPLRTSSRSRAASRCWPICIHNAGDAATAIPLGIAFALRSAAAQRTAGLAVVLAIFVSARVAGYEATHRLIDPADVEHLGAPAAAGAVVSSATGSPRSSARAPGAGSTARRSSPTRSSASPSP